MAEGGKDGIAGTRYADTHGGALNVVTPEVNTASQAVLRVIEKEIGSGPWTDEDVRRAADLVWSRAKNFVDQRNDDLRQREEREAARQRLEAMDEPTRIIKQRLPELPVEKMSSAERLDLARNIVQNEGEVWKVGEFHGEYVPPNALPPPSYYAEARAKAAEAAREAALKEAQ